MTKYMTNKELSEILATMPPEVCLIANGLGNLTVYNGDCEVLDCEGNCMGQYIGFIDFHPNCKCFESIID